VDKLHRVKPSHCGCCGKRLWGSDPDPRRHQVTEIPPIQPTVEEWQLHGLSCSDCGTVTRATLPEGVPTGSFGPRVQALVAVAGGVYRMSKRSIQGFMSDVCGVKLSLGAVSKLEKRTAEAVAQPVAEAHEHVRNAPVVHADETGWRENKSKAWLWLAATATVAVFLIHARRAKEVARELLGAAFAGVLVTDRFGSYNFVAKAKRQVCWAHLLRDVEAFRAFGRRGVLLATEIQTSARTLIRYYHRVRDGTMTRDEFRRKAKRYRKRILSALRRGRGYARSEISGVCKEIYKLRVALFTFVDHEGVEPTNNHAEQLLRHAVIWRKISFGTDSPNGSRFVERMLTVVMSLRLQKRNVLDYVTEACEAALCGRQSPSLLPSAHAAQLAAAA
jgi:transposase